MISESRLSFDMLTRSDVVENALELGRDCLGSIHYFDVPVADEQGAPFTMKNAVCMHKRITASSGCTTNSAPGCSMSAGRAVW